MDHQNNTVAQPPSIKIERAAVKLAHKRYPNLSKNEPVPPHILDETRNTIIDALNRHDDDDTITAISNIKISLT